MGVEEVIDSWLLSESPTGAIWAVTISYFFMLVIIGLVGFALRKVTKAKLVYGIVLVVGLILFLKTVFDYDVTGILWNAYVTIRDSIMGVII